MKSNLQDLAFGLINKGLSLNAVNCYRETPLMCAIAAKNISLVEECLLVHGKTLDLNTQDKDNRTLLHYAVMERATSIIEKLLQLGADPDIKNSKGATPLQLAFANEDHNGIQILFKARPNTKLNVFSTGDADSALHVAVKIESIWLLNLCLERGLKINCSNALGKTPLHLAIEKKNYDIIKILLESDKSCDIVNVSDRDGKTFLHRAVEENDLEVVKRLVEYGALVKIYDGNGKTPIDIADEKNFYKVSNFLRVSIYWIKGI